MNLLKSAVKFLHGMLKRFYFLLPAVLLDPWDLYNQYLRVYFSGRDAPEIKLPDEAFPYVLAVGLFVAAILTYHGLRSGVGRNKQVLRKLKEIYMQGGELVGREIANDEEFNKYETEMFAWSNAASKWVESNMGDAAASLLRDKQGILPYVRDTDYNQKHSHYINFVTKLRQNLTQLIDSAAWDKIE